MHYPEIIPLDQYKRPTGPAVHQLEDWFQSVRKKFVDRGSQVTVTDDQLATASIESIRAFTDEPDCAFVFQTLDDAYLDWMHNASTDDHVKLLVFPPCDRSERVTSWAEHNHVEILKAPDRADLLAMDMPTIEIPDGDAPLVIPKLETWFIRHRSGLRHIRALLSALQNTTRPCLASCNSWSWIYLKKAVNADLVLPAPDSLAPFDAEGLGNWLLALLSEDSDSPVIFRDHKDGKEIFRRDKDGTLSDDFLQQLADDSGGIPWIAWQLWRRSLRTQAQDDSEDDDDSDKIEKPDKQENSGATETVFWVVRNRLPTLPRGHERAASLLLQALLIHGSLPEQLLSTILPSIGESNLVVALIRSGFIERHDGEVRCLSTAYPVIWTSLENSGMTMASF